MTTELGPAYTPDWRGRPAHMAPNDSLLWTLWYPTITQPTDTIHFDVAVSRLPPPDTTNLDPAMARMWTRVTAKRIDAVIIRPAATWLVELRWDASESAIGRLLTYADLWTLDPPTTNPPDLHIVTNRPGPQWTPTAQRLGITVHVVANVA